jgi:hypothetical protein
MTTTEQQQNRSEQITLVAHAENFHWAFLTDQSGTARSILHNQWGGMDFHQTDGSCLRVYPIDGEWDAGFTAHHLSRNTTLLATMEFHGKATPNLVARTLDLLRYRDER